MSRRWICRKPRKPAVTSVLVLTGPGGVRAADTDYFQREVRGRGLNRRPHDLVVVLETGVARLQLDPERRSRIDRHGLWVHSNRVLGATTRRVRELVERAEQVHLCRNSDCQGGPGVHCVCFAAVDAESLVDLGAYDRLTAWRLGVLTWRSLYAIGAAFRRWWRIMGTSVGPRRGGDLPARQIHEEGVLRQRDPDSESENEAVTNPCEAERVGLILQGRQHALAPEGCQDKASQDPTRLLDEDKHLSDLGGREVASLCNHHSQLYMLACQGRKCSVVSCFATAKGARNGAPFCKKHLAEAARSPSPKGSSTPNRKPSDNTLSSALRAAAARQSGDFPPVKDEFVDRRVSFSDAPASLSDAAPFTPVRRRNPTPPPSAALVEIDHPKEIEPAEGPVLVRLRPFFGPGRERPWYIYRGDCRGVAPDGRRNERVRVEVPSLGIVLSIPWSCIGATPSTSQHRLPAGWLTQYLNTNPDDLEAAGIAVQAVRIPESHLRWLEDWDGSAVCPAGTATLPPLKGDQLRRLMTQPELCLLPHEDGRLLSPASGDFATPPRPTDRGSRVDRETQDLVPSLDDKLPSDLELWAQYEEEKARNQDSASAIALVASAYDCEPNHVRAAVMRCLEREGTGVEQADLLGPPPLPPPDVPPPGPNPFGRALVNPAREATALSVTAPGLVNPRTTTTQNPLLASSSVVSRATGLVGEEQPTKERLTSALFPTRQGVSDTRPKGLWSGLPSKAGATFTEALGSSTGATDSGTLAADRIIHALDGLRKVQDEDRTGTKGTLSSIKEGEKLDVFLARGCGQLTIEVCEGVYGKELFQAMKRVGHHAKHELLLLKWPVLITNRIALAVSGLWWGGEESYTLLASDCQTARADQVETWSPPTEHKMEGRSKAPASFLTWLRYAENHTRVFGAVYGVEHMQERYEFLKALQEAHEEDEHAYPTTYCIKLFEELNAVWCEQVRESRRTLCARLGTENPRMEDLKLLALAPSSGGALNFRFPRVWDLNDPAGYFQQVIVPRQERALNRLLHRQLHDATIKEKREGTRKTAWLRIFPWMCSYE